LGSKKTPTSRGGQCRRSLSAARLKAMIEDATVDAYGESEQVGGFYTMLDEHLAVPFETTLRGPRSCSMRAFCRRVMTAVLADDTQLFKEFSDNESFRRWLTERVFGLTYGSGAASGSQPSMRQGA